ncbi:MAG: hypothetical protein ACPGXL_01165 [Chitinophagales bacterium]
MSIELGVRKLKLLFEAIQHGYGLNRMEELYPLCEIMWLQNKSQQHKFRTLFERIVEKAIVENRQKK